MFSMTKSKLRRTDPTMINVNSQPHRWPTVIKLFSLCLLPLEIVKIFIRYEAMSIDCFECSAVGSDPNTCPTANDDYQTWKEKSGKFAASESSDLHCSIVVGSEWAFVNT